MRVLVAEDHQVLARTVATGLRRQSMAVDVTGSGDEAERMCLRTDYDVLILDRDLPVLTGDEVCRRLRALADPPRILLLTAAGEITDKVYGLQELGADDYLAKPFDFVELVARVRALSRRAPGQTPAALCHAGITLDRARREARVAGRPVGLTPKEFAVLHLLVEARGRHVTHDHLVRTVWDEHLDPRTTAVRATVSRLRGKLGGPDTITADTGLGYRLHGLPGPLR
ncbi:response regulator transcription factor [Streptomyces sp. NPDC088789]|uniref:response regulator transcription factor n=1 Tax=Streptomyces sp. NPDC088789 TaxID=3365899 RepID=UPI00382E27B7